MSALPPKADIKTIGQKSPLLAKRRHLQALESLIFQYIYNLFRWFEILRRSADRTVQGSQKVFYLAELGVTHNEITKL